MLWYLVIPNLNSKEAARDPMVFCKLGTKLRSRQVLEQIVDAIRSGHFLEGDRLPPERELARQLGVSRTPVREALSILHAVGAVSRLQGSGTYVTAAGDTVLDQAFAIVDEGGSSQEIFDWQQLLEPGVALLAMQRATPAGLETARTALDQMRNAVRNCDRPSYSESDRCFHLAVADMTENDIIIRQMSRLYQLMEQKVWTSIKGYGIEPDAEEWYLAESLGSHERLFEAIRAGDSEAVEGALAQHYRTVREVVFEGEVDLS